jgi:hypothetical protein
MATLDELQVSERYSTDSSAGSSVGEPTRAGRQTVHEGGRAVPGRGQ